jgi:hypothetical protein
VVEEARRVVPERLSAFELRARMVRDPDAALAKWQAYVEVAREHLRSGYHAWEAVAPLTQPPSGLAQFIPWRQDLIFAFQTRNAVEQMFIDDLTQMEWQTRRLEDFGGAREGQPRGPGGRPFWTRSSSPSVRHRRTRIRPQILRRR